MRRWIASTDWILFNLQISIVVFICSCRIGGQLVTTFMHRNCGVILAFLGKRRRPANAQPRITTDGWRVIFVLLDNIAPPMEHFFRRMSMLSE